MTSFRTLRPSAPLTLALALAVSAGLPAQNLLKNGDFSSKDAQGNPISWNQKFDLPGSVMKFDVDGTGPSDCFGVSHGKGSNTATGIGELTQDQVLVVQSLNYELHADIAVGGSFNTDPGKFEFFVDNVSVGVVDMTTARGSKAAGVTFRERVCLRFTPKTSGLKQFKIEISRQFLAAANRTPLAYVDNVFLTQTGGPAVCLRGERMAGSAIPLEIAGNPNTSVALFAGVGQLATPISIPGWTGKLELQAPVLPLLFTKTNNTGVFSINVPTQAALKGAGIWLQGAQAGTGTVVHLGPSQPWNLY